MKKYIFSLLALGPLLALLWLSLYTGHLYLKPYSGSAQTFVIAKGESFSQINYRLKQKELIPAPRLFYKLAQWRGTVEKLRSGTYQIATGMRMSDIMDLLTKGSQVFIDVTIAEGKNMFEIAQILGQKELVSAAKFLELAQDSKFIASLGITAERAEGYLYPDTYKFEIPADGKNIISIMVKNFFKKTKYINLEKTPFTLHQLITLSSIVEKETGAASERPIIAGVFLNRLKKRMRLQSDPTTIYGIYETFNGNLRKKHLLQKTPYNTYQISGLPVGPIANPGIEAIEAVLKPQRHNFLYFVSKNDGTHVFTSTYKDHLRAVDNWQKRRANRKGRSWRQLDKTKRANQPRY